VLLVAVGDVMVDFSASIAAPRFATGMWIGENSEISLYIGGTPVHVCAGVNAVAGWRTHLVSAVGGQLDPIAGSVPDMLGQLAQQYLSRNGIDHSCEIVPERSTGRALLVYPPGDGRLMIADTVTSPSVSARHLAEVLRSARTHGDRMVGHLAGYTHFGPEGEKLVRAMRTGAGANALLWLDVVPHDIHQRLSVAAFTRRLESIDLVTMDRATLDGFARTARGGLLEVTDLVLATGATLAVVDDDVIVITGPLSEKSLACPALLTPDLDRTPGARDRIVAQTLARFLQTRLGPIPHANTPAVAV
jgi:sugar/nucleoside kinase (ribokinase family)